MYAGRSHGAVKLHSRSLGARTLACVPTRHPRSQVSAEKRPFADARSWAEQRRFEETPRASSSQTGTSAQTGDRPLNP